MTLQSSPLSAEVLAAFVPPIWSHELLWSPHVEPWASAAKPPVLRQDPRMIQRSPQRLVEVVGMVHSLVQGLERLYDFFVASMLCNNGRGGVIYHDFRKNNKNHLPPRFIVGKWLAGPVLRSRGMVSSMTLATVKVIGEVEVVMGGNVGVERRVQMWSDSDERKIKKKCDRQLSLYIAV